MKFAATWSLCLAIGGMLSSAPASAQQYVDLVFTGTVTYDTEDPIAVRNPDGSTTAIDPASIPEYLFPEGSELTITYSFDANSQAFQNPACGGKGTLSAGGAADFTECSVHTRVTTPFGATGFGGVGGDSSPFIRGLGVEQDPETGAFSVSAPTDSYSFGFVGVNPYFWDSATQTLSGPTGERCFDAFNCYGGIGMGTTSAISFLIPIAGDFGLVQPGYDVGYLAGNAQTLSIVGGFSPIGGTPVPAPGMLLIFGAAAGGLAARRRLRVKSRPA